MVFDSNRYKYEFKDIPSDFSQLGLGNFVEAYDDQKDRNSYELIMRIILLSSILAVTVFCFFISYHLSIIFAGCLLLLLFKTVTNTNSHRFYERFYIFEQGVVQEKVKKKSRKRISYDIIHFEDVASIISYKERKYKGNNGNSRYSFHKEYVSSSRKLTIKDQKGNILLDYKGNYENEGDKGEMFSCVWFVVKAIERQWRKRCLPALWQELQNTSQILFPIGSHSIKLSNDGIVYDQKQFIQRENLIIEWLDKAQDEKISIRDKNIKRTGLQKIMNQDEIIINVNAIPNGCLLAPLLQQLYGVELETEIKN